MLKSILAQAEYTAAIKQYVCQGIRFDAYLHVPEIHDYTGSLVCQREDEGHLFKVFRFLSQCIHSVYIILHFLIY